MKKKIIVFIILLLIVSFTFSYIYKARNTSPDTNIDSSIDNEEEVIVLPDKLWDQYCQNFIDTQQLIDKLSSEEKVKQLLAPIYTGSSIESETFTKNIGFYALIKVYSYKSSQEINTVMSKINIDSKIPAFIGLDAEGSPINRLSWHKFTHISQFNCDTATDDINALKQSGFNWSLGPVVDLPNSENDWIYNRTISMDKSTVIKTAQEYINCMRDKKILTSAKHFPGHGATITDSHTDIPQINYSKEEWLNTSGEIYDQLDMDSIMTGHLVYPKISSEISSSSPFWSKIIRDELNFKGLIITDDINMLSPKTTDECYGLITDALNNSADVVIFGDSSICNTNKIITKLQENNFTKDDSVKKILETKKKLLCN
jgi:beta-N-acetylhexosaminidase